MSRNIKMIAAVSLNGVCGRAGDLPWKKDGKNLYPEDLAYFRKCVPHGSTIIMGRKEFALTGKLPKRRTVVLSRNAELVIPGVEVYASLERALEATQEEETVWIGGGLSVYRQALPLVSEIVLTLIPEVYTGEELAYFPFINPAQFSCEHSIINAEKGLAALQFKKMAGAPASLMLPYENNKELPKGYVYDSDDIDF